jgi:hypothetical protein
MGSFLFAVLAIGIVALVCRKLWQARRDKALQKAIAAGMAVSVVDAALTDNSADGLHDWSGGEGGGDD